MGNTKNWIVMTALAACNSPGGGGGGSPYTESVNEYCKSYCGKVSECDGMAVELTCTANCQNGAAATLPKMRADILTQIETCVKAKKCSDVLHGPVQAACAGEVVASASASTAATDYCSALDKALNHCGMTGGDKSDCLNNAKLFNDATLQLALKCTGLSCTQLKDCVSAELPAGFGTNQVVIHPIGNDGGGGGTTQFGCDGALNGSACIDFTGVPNSQLASLQQSCSSEFQGSPSTFLCTTADTFGGCRISVSSYSRTTWYFDASGNPIKCKNDGGTWIPAGAN